MKSLIPQNIAVARQFSASMITSVSSIKTFHLFFAAAKQSSDKSPENFQREGPVNKCNKIGLEV